MGVFENISKAASGGGKNSGFDFSRRSWSKKPSLQEPTSEKIAKKPDSQREDYLGKKFSHRDPAKTKIETKEPEIKQLPRGAFAEKTDYTRDEANQWLADKLHKSENWQLLKEILAEDPPRPEETWYQWAERANNRIFGGLDASAHQDKISAAGYIISSIDDKQILLNRRSYLEKSIAEETSPDKKRGKEIDLKIFDFFVGALKE